LAIGLFSAVVVMACNVDPGGGLAGPDAATAAARIKGGMESQAGAVKAFETSVAAAQPTIQAAAKGATIVTPDQASQAARAEVARVLNVPPEQVAVERIESVEWSDSSLGCRQPGMAYAQVIVPGFRVVLSGGGQRREVHTDMAGRLVVCPNPTQ
jgi:hypothetical protein